MAVPKIEVGQVWEGKFPAKGLPAIRITRIGTVLISRTALRPFKTNIEVEAITPEQWRYSSMDISALRSDYKLRKP